MVWHMATWYRNAFSVSCHDQTSSMLLKVFTISIQGGERQQRDYYSTGGTWLFFISLRY